MPEISITPHHIAFFGFEVGASVVMGSFVVLLLVILCVLINLRVRRFQEKPTGIQNLIELAVESVYQFSKGKVGHNADFCAPMVLTLMTFIATATLVELFGLPPATEDLSCTLALGFTTFLLVNVTALREFGLLRRIRRMASPAFFVLPIRMMTDLVAPVSMALRLFINVMVGGIVMKLIYSAIPLVLPAAVSVYFNLIHVAIQTFVFGLLTLNYTMEATE